MKRLAILEIPMYQSDHVLKMYAESGLRSVEDWTASGRDVPSDAKPRVDRLHHGERMALFSRDQTQRRTPSRKRLHH
jgi:hypothetical protein